MPNVSRIAITVYVVKGLKSFSEWLATGERSGTVLTIGLLTRSWPSAVSFIVVPYLRIKLNERAVLAISSY